jgi:hypothetical protein
MAKADGRDTADRLSAIVASSLDTPAKTQDLARQAYQSRVDSEQGFTPVSAVAGSAAIGPDRLVSPTCAPLPR